MYIVPGRTDTEVVQAILGNAAMTEKARKTSMALLRAALIGQTWAVKTLLAEGIDVNTRDGCGRTALMEAAFSGHTETLRVLLKNGAEVNVTDCDGWTALIEAASKGYSDAVRVLLAAGADVNTKSKNGWTALKAAARGHTEIIKLLKNAGARG